MGWGGIIAGGLGGLGKGMAQYGQMQLEKNDKLDLMNEQARIDQAKMEAAEQLRQSGHMWNTTGDGGAATRDAARATYEQETKLGTQRLTDQAGTKRDIAVQDERELGKVRAENAGVEAGARRKGELSAEADLGNDPKARAGIAKLAQARHVESAGSLAQAALAKLQIEDLKTAQGLSQQLAEANKFAGAQTDPKAKEEAEKRVAEIRQQISDRAFKGKDTAEAYRAWNSASAKLVDLEIKAKDAPPEVQEQIKAEMGQIRAMRDQAARELGVKPVNDPNRFPGMDKLLPEKGAAKPAEKPAEAPTQVPEKPPGPTPGVLRPHVVNAGRAVGGVISDWWNKPRPRDPRLPPLEDQ